MDELTLIGYWHDATYDDGLPNPAHSVDETWAADEREDVAAYLYGGIPVIHMMGFSLCRLCNEQNGTSELTDGVYLWPSGLAHYVTDHSVRLPKVVIDLLHGRIVQLEAEAARAHQQGTHAWIKMKT